jgi:predicted ferric reductase
MRIFEVLVPFSMSREFKSVLGFDIGKSVALGGVAFYLILIIILTSKFRSKIPQKLWRGIHYAAFPVYVLFVLHGFMSGTDSREWWMRIIYSASVSIVALLILVRIIFRNLLPKWRSNNAKNY